MLRDKRLIISIVGIALVVGLVIVITGRQNSSKQATPPSSIQFTDAITGEKLNDIIAEDGSLAPDVIDRPSVQIGGISSLYNQLTTDQASNAQTIINDFLMAHSGLMSVHAGIKDGAVIKNGDNLELTLAVQRPQATYDVTVHVSNDLQLIPDVTFKQAEQ